MEEKIQQVRDYYNENVAKEWERLQRHPYEFAITVRMMDRHIQSGDSILILAEGRGANPCTMPRRVAM
jgi:hypothetical protein